MDSEVGSGGDVVTAAHGVNGRGEHWWRPHVGSVKRFIFGGCPWCAAIAAAAAECERLTGPGFDWNRAQDANSALETAAECIRKLADREDK